jgi:tRNA G18 (ribose-2'-O)-methylase SpoU
VERVESLEDPRLAVYRDLPRANLARPSGLFIAEGALVVDRLLRSGLSIESVLVDEQCLDEFRPRLPSGVQVFTVPRALVNPLVGFKFHRGILACGRRPATPSLASLIPANSAATNSAAPNSAALNSAALNSAAPTTAATKTAVIASDIQDPENLGCVLRNSAAFGVDLVLLSRSCADPFSRRVLRTSMGTVFTLPLRQSESLADDVAALADDYGFELAATVLDASAESLYDAERPSRFGLVFGNEAHGVDDRVAARCRRRVTLPMRRGTDSLNVGVASAVFLYHFTAPSRMPR